MTHNTACWMQREEQRNPRAPGQPPGQRFFNVSTAKARLCTAAIFLARQDAGRAWTVAHTLSDVYVHLHGCKGFTILLATLEASFQPAKVDLWSISTTFLSRISQKGKKNKSTCDGLRVCNTPGACGRADLLDSTERRRSARSVAQRIGPATQPPQVPHSALLTKSAAFGLHMNA